MSLTCLKYISYLALKGQEYFIVNVILIVVHRSEEPALTNMDISTGHMVLVSYIAFHH
jgi:hypothetical protein